MSARRRESPVRRRPSRRRRLVARPAARGAAAARREATVAAPERPSRHDRHAARRPPRLLRLRARRATPTLDGLAAPRRALRRRPWRTRPSPARRTPRSSPASLRSATASGTTAAYVLPARRADARPRTSGRPATARRPSSRASRSNRRFGFDRGFDTYDDHLPARQRSRAGRRTSSAPPTATTDAALALAAGAVRRGDAPFFLWVHYFDPHAPYEPAAASWPAFRARPTTARSRSSTRSSGACCARSSERARSARTLVLVTADHGESLGEHGEDTHGIFVYDATLRVPWIMAGPGVPAGACRADGRPRHRRAARRCSTTPASPSRPRSKGARCGRAVDGREMSDAPAYAESLYPQRQYGWAPLHALADRALQADRGAAPRALRPRARTREEHEGPLRAGARPRLEAMRRKLAGAGASTDARAPRRRWTPRRRSGWRRSATSVPAAARRPAPTGTRSQGRHRPRARGSTATA